MEVSLEGREHSSKLRLRELSVRARWGLFRALQAAQRQPSRSALPLACGHSRGQSRDERAWALTCHQCSSPDVLSHFT